MPAEAAWGATRRCGAIAPWRWRRAGRRGWRAVAEGLGTVVGVGVADRRRCVLRAAVAAALAGVSGITEAAALGVGARGVAILSSRALRAVLRAVARSILSVVSLAARRVSAVVFPLVAVEGAVIVIGEQVAKKRVLAVEDPKIAAVAMVPIAVLVGTRSEERRVG